MIEQIARMIAAHVGEEKFWGLYKETAKQILDYIEANQNNKQ